MHRVYMLCEEENLRNCGNARENFLISEPNPNSKQQEKNLNNAHKEDRCNHTQFADEFLFLPYYERQEVWTMCGEGKRHIHVRCRLRVHVQRAGQHGHVGQVGACSRIFLPAASRGPAMPTFMHAAASRPAVHCRSHRRIHRRRCPWKSTAQLVLKMFLQLISDSSMEVNYMYRRQGVIPLT